MVSAVFEDGSRERGDVLIGADGIHSVVRRSLFGDEKPRYAGYYAWRGVAHGASELLPKEESLLTLGTGVQSGCFHCGNDRVYWFLTCSGASHSQPNPDGNQADILQLIKNWRTPMRQFVEVTDAKAILRNDIIDRPPRLVWGKGRTTLLGDSIHATTPNLGQGACMAMEDAVILAHSLCTIESEEEALRNYERLRRERTQFIIEQSWQLGKVLQLSNPIAVWLRNAMSRTKYANRHSEKMFERLFDIDLPELQIP
jgi:2-polyprenyl-6-methoxyphenol hydroxylase-like FAD-dependent oxidoreductase